LQQFAIGSTTGTTEDGFRQRFPWIGGHLQTIRNVTMRRAGWTPPESGQRIWLDTDDGSGDVIALRLSVPDHPDPDGKPLVLLIHGLSGCEDSMNQRMSTAWFLERGHAVLRLNLRGAGPSEARCSRRYHSGHTADLDLAIRYMTRRTDIVGAAGIVAMGVSLGGVILLNHLINSGQDAGLRAAVTISSPLDLAGASRRFMAPSNILYKRHLLERMKAMTLTAMPSPEWEPVIRGCRNVWEFDDRIVAPWNGYGGAEDYYERCAPLPRLGLIRTPVMLIHAEDDPWVPAGPYRMLDDVDAPLHVRLLPRGGHVGFHEKGSIIPWHNRAAAAFFEEFAMSRTGHAVTETSRAA
jgi:hypothetical protein